VQRLSGTTLLIPVHHTREKLLLDLLESVVLAQRSAWYPSEALVITRDIDSIDTLVHTAFPEFPIPLHTAFFPESKTLAALRNNGLRAVQTEWVHGIDCDCRVSKDFFVVLERAMKRSEASGSCFQLNFEGTDTPHRLARYEATIDKLILSRYISQRIVCGMAGVNFLSRCDLLLSAGGFAEDLVSAEDVELGYRLHAIGIRVEFLPEVSVSHEYPIRLKDLLYRKFWHGRGYLSVSRRCPRLFLLQTPRKDEILSYLKLLVQPGLFLYMIASHLVFLSGAVTQLIKPGQRS